MRPLTMSSTLACLVLVIALLGACNRDYAPLNPQVSTFAPPVPRWPILFDDFEQGALTYPYTYSSAPDPISMAVAVGGAHGGLQSLLCQFSTSASGFAGGGGGTNYPDPGRSGVDVTGLTKIELWVKTDRNISFGISIKEGNAAGNSPLNEEWVSPNQSLTASAAWQQVTFNWLVGPGNFTLKTPSGNASFDPGNISNVNIAFGSGIPAANVYIDDIRFRND